VDADVPLEHRGFVDLPVHVNAGGFDHAAVHGPTGLIYVAHTANDAIDVIDVQRQRYVGSIAGLSAVAGALVSDDSDLVFTSNRGENTVGMFAPTKPTEDRPTVEKIGVGIRPNGLAFSPRHARLLVAHVGDPVRPASCTVSLVDVPTRRRIADLPVSGRTRWTVHDPVADVFHVNIADPPEVVVVNPGDPIGIRRTVPIPHAGPHGLDIDVARRRLFCACDAGVLLEIDADSGAILATEAIAGVPDVVFFNARLSHLYVAIGDPGLIEVFDTVPLRRHEVVPSEPGAHTLSFDATRNLLCAFLPATHRAAVYLDHA
jgi:DNA-binding beta-propeller fold protein YncE